MIDTAFILCGGKGTRLAPLTNDIPKPLLPIQGKPILEHLIDLLKHYGVKKVILGTGHMGDKIQNYFGDGNVFDVNILYTREKELLGTAGALKLATKYIDGPFFMFNGDNMYGLSLESLFEKHKQTNAEITIALKSVENPSMYGVAELDGEMIVKFLEKPDNPPTNLINAGAYVIEKQILDLIPDGNVSIEREIFPKIAEKKKLFAFRFDNQWFPTDTMDRYKNANEQWKSPF